MLFAVVDVIVFFICMLSKPDYLLKKVDELILSVLSNEIKPIYQLRLSSTTFLGYVITQRNNPSMRTNCNRIRI